MAQDTVVVTIGRNIRGEPMPSKQWAQFQKDTVIVIEDWDAIILSSPLKGDDQRGMWEGEVEASAVFVAHVPVEYVTGLRRDISKLRGRYSQETAGFIVAPGTDNLA